MTSITLNQTESEKRLNRILYYIKVLRALIINGVLFSLAIGLYMAFGITGLYPMAEDTINSLRPHMDQPERYIYILTDVTVLFLGTTFSVWLYISLVRAWRKSLKAQSILGVILIPIDKIVT